MNTLRLSEFKRACELEFGVAQATVLISEYWLPQLRATPAEALSSNADVRRVWLALCEEMNVPEERRHGAGKNI
ncbi:DUF3046 domain-containing protein [Canibacter zhuwentaonis]|uniref:DUF3046 domain-containing protein n=1 Tax=Canibacter zhuwentaonis TaxID=2837491 RepID=UPI0032B5DFC7